MVYVTKPVTVLFRLLFIAYAEDRDLLPYRFNDAYRRHTRRGLTVGDSSVRGWWRTSVFRNLYANHCFYVENKKYISQLPTFHPTFSVEIRRFTQNNRSQIGTYQATQRIGTNSATSRPVRPALTRRTRSSDAISSTRGAPDQGCGGFRARRCSARIDIAGRQGAFFLCGCPSP